MTIEMKKNNNRPSDGAKAFYSLRELFPEIMEYKDPPEGLTYEENNFTYNADYKRIQRLVSTLKKMIGNYEKGKQISAEDKEGFVAITKRLRKELFDNPSPSPIQKAIAKKIKSCHDLIDEELTYLINVFQETIAAHKNIADQELLLLQIQKSEDFYKWRDEMLVSFSRDISLIEKIEQPLKQKEMMEHYQILIESSQLLTDFRVSVEKVINEEDMVKRTIMYSEKMGLDPQPILMGKDTEGIRKITEAMVKDDIIKLLQEN